jgi:hypothetical protein
MRPAHGPFKAGAPLLFGIDFTKLRLGVRFLQRMGETKGVGKAVKTDLRRSENFGSVSV